MVSTMASVDLGFSVSAQPHKNTSSLWKFIWHLELEYLTCKINKMNYKHFIVVTRYSPLRILNGSS